MGSLTAEPRRELPRNEYFETEQLGVLLWASTSFNWALTTIACELKGRRPVHNRPWVKDYKIKDVSQLLS